MTQNNTSEEKTAWNGDVLNRKQYSLFLSKYINSRIANTGQPLTIALDSAWGSGKTFFVQNWAEDIDKNIGGAIIFDAWKNDFSNDVLTSFMAELSIGMKPLRERIAAKTKIIEKLNTEAQGLVKSFQKAALPATTIIIKAMLQKFTGVAMDQIFDAIKDQKNIDINDFDWNKATDGIEQDFEKGLETFFEKTLQAHKARATATQQFKNALEKLVDTLQSENAINGPLYIFIDELDRCRPDYAIKLLEGIKHLFSVKGVVFVVSTNLDQLSKSVQAVYGAGFDGHSYLKRFFDFEFVLPEPDNYEFAQLLFNELPIFEQNEIEPGLQKNAYKEQSLLARSFQLISTACDLSLRNQKQVWLIASAASSSIPRGKHISSIWLFFLCALRHSYPTVFEKLNEKLSLQQFAEACTSIKKTKETTVKFFRRKSVEINPHIQEDQVISLITLLHVYHTASFQTIDDINNSINNKNIEYPQSLLKYMTNESDPNQELHERRPYIKNYHFLVKMAGQIANID